MKRFLRLKGLFGILVLGYAGHGLCATITNTTYVTLYSESAGTHSVQSNEVKHIKAPHTQWIKINGSTQTTIPADGSFTITANTTDEVEFFFYIDWKRNSQLDPEDTMDDCFVIEDNSVMDEDLETSVVQITRIPYHMLCEVSGSLIILARDVATKEKAYASLLFQQPTHPVELKGRLTLGGRPVLGRVFAGRNSEEGWYLTTTNENGEYSLQIPEGVWKFCAFIGKSPGAVGTEEEDRYLSAGTHTVDFEFEEYPTATISGKVTSGGEPIMGAEVEAETDDDEYSALTDENGSYTLIVESGKNYKVEVRRYGYINDERYDISPGATVNFDLQKATLTISGKVTGSGPLVGADVETEGCDSFTNRDGNYLLYLPSGSFEISAEMRGYAEVGTQAEAGDTNVDINLIRHNSTITGTVYYSDGETPCPLTWVEAEYESDSHSDEAICIADKDGNYTLYVIKGWEYEIEATKEIDDEEYSTTTTATAPANVDLILPVGPPVGPPGTISGIISYSGTKSGTLIYVAFDDPEEVEDPIGETITFAGPGSIAYSLSVPSRPEPYYLAAVLDIDNSGDPSVGEPIGVYGTLFYVTEDDWAGSFTPVYVQAGSVTSGIDFELTHEVEPTLGSVTVYDSAGNFVTSTTTISEGIDNCPTGGTVSVAAGTYTGASNKNLSWDPATKHIAVIGENSVIDCEHNGRAFYLSGGHTPKDLISGFTIINGSGADSGGGICIHSGSPTITNCIFSNNSAGDNGGGIYCNNSFPTIVNCIFSNNSANWGGGIYCHNSSPTITNCIFSNNSAEIAGGICCYNNSSPVITNTIVAYNIVPTLGGGIWTSSDSNPTLDYNCFYGNSPDNYAGNASAGANHKDQDPQFIDWANGDFHLGTTSPCIDTGSNSALPAGITTDLDGNSRIVNSIVDMGAYEYQGIPTVVTGTITGNIGYYGTATGNVYIALLEWPWGEGPSTTTYTFDITSPGTYSYTIKAPVGTWAVAGILDADGSGIIEEEPTPGDVLGIYGTGFEIMADGELRPVGTPTPVVVYEGGITSGIDFELDFVVPTPPRFPISYCTITPDGSPTDWEGISPMGTDTVGDKATTTSGFDLKEIYMAVDEENFYLRMDVADPPISPEEGVGSRSYRFSIEHNGGTLTDVEIKAHWDFYDNKWCWKVLCYDEDTGSWIDEVKERAECGVGSITVEISVPLEIFDNPTEFEIRPAIWQVGDEFDKASKIIAYIPQPGTITGIISYDGTETGILCWAAFSDISFSEEPVAAGTLSVYGPFHATHSLCLTPNTYYMLAFIDRDGGEVDAPEIGDPVGIYGTLSYVTPSEVNPSEIVVRGTPTPVAISAGEICSGIDFSLTHEVEPTPSQYGTITGTISYSGTKSGTLLYGVFDNIELHEPKVVGSTTFSGPGGIIYTLSVPGTVAPYYVASVLDVDRSGDPSLGEPVGIYGTLSAWYEEGMITGSFIPVYVSAGSVTSGIDFELTHEVEPAPLMTIYVDTNHPNASDDNSGTDPSYPKKTIQAGIDACHRGTVCVAAGTYTESVNINNKSFIRLIGAGANKTVIFPPSGYNGVNFHDVEDGLISGFKIRGVSSQGNQGIYCRNSTLTVTNNIITENINEGIVCGEYTNVVITNNIFSKNGQYGAICGYGPYSTILLIKNNTIIDNSSLGIHLADACGTVTHNTILNNGKGIYCDQRCYFVIANNLIADNDSDGIDCAGTTSTTVINNTISLNDGYGIHLHPYGSITICNNIITENGKNGIHCRENTNYWIAHNNVWNNSGVNYWGCSAGQNDISSDPQFVVGDDYHLGTTSPCIDTGSNSALPAGITTDLDGNPRIVNGTVDMGAYEFQGTYTQWVKINGVSQTTVPADGSFTITANTTDELEFFMFIDWDRDRVLDPEDAMDDCFMVEDNGVMDEDPATGIVQITRIPYHMVREVSGSLIILAMDVATKEKAYASVLFQQPTHPVELKGRLTLDGRPVLGRVFAGRNSEEGWYLTTTNENGEYSLQIPEGAWRICSFIGDSPGPVGTEEEERYFSAGTYIVDFEFEQYPTATISGRVTSGGEPIMGAEVEAEIDDDEYSALTDENGNYTLIVESGKIYKVEVRRYGYINDERYDISPGATVNFELQNAAFTISGRVTGSSPLLGAHVDVGVEIGDYYGCFTNKDGNYLLYLPSGSFEIRAGMRGYATTKVQANAGDTNVDIELTRHNSTITGTVYYSDGVTPVPFAEVEAEHDSENIHDPQCITDINGRYTLYVVEGWTYEVKAEKEIEDTEYSTTTTATAPTEVNLTLPIAPPEIWVEKIGPATAKIGELATYTINFGNKGSETATNVKLIDMLPKGAEFAGTNWNPSGSETTDNGLKLYWDIGEIEGDCTITGLLIFCTITTTGTLTNYATITSDYETEIVSCTTYAESGPLHKIKIEDQEGKEIGEVSLTTDDTLTLYLRGYDEWGNLIGPVEGSWTVFGQIGVCTPTYGTFTVFDPTKVGEGTITATDGSFTDRTGLITVSIGEIIEIKIEDAQDQEIGTVNITADATLTVYLMGYDADSNETHIAGTWTVLGGIGTISPIYGPWPTFDPTTVGVGTITAQYDSLRDETGTITVIHGSPTAFNLHPSTFTLTADDSITFTAIAKDNDGNTWTVTAEFSEDDPIGTITADGIYYAGKVGVWTITATYKELSATATVTVKHGSPTSLCISPAFATLTADDEQEYRGTATDLDGNTWDVTAETEFSTDEPWGTITANIYYPAKAGTWTITATYKELSATATVIITPGAFTELAICAPLTATTYVPFEMVVSLTDSDKNPYDGKVSLSNTTSSIEPTEITLISGSRTFFAAITTAPEGGIDTITVSYQTVTASAKITVYLNPELGGTVTAEGARIVFGTSTQAFTVSVGTSATLPEQLPPNITFANILYRIDLSPKTTVSATLFLEYPDKDDDGWVDGTKIEEENLKVYQLNQVWTELLTKIKPKKNIAITKVTHFSDFALAGVITAPATVTGRCLDIVTNKPVENATVTVGTYTAQTNEQGLYTITDIPQGPATITFLHSDYYTEEELITIEPDETIIKDVFLCPIKLKILADAWTMVSLPAKPTKIKAAQVVLPTPTTTIGTITPDELFKIKPRFKLVRWDPLAEDLGPPQMRYREIDLVKIGEGYWIKVYDRSADIRFLGKKNRKPVNIKLFPGWNIIGAPFTQFAEFSSDATEPLLWTWNGKGYETSTTLTPWSGYWIWAETETTVELKIKNAKLKMQNAEEELDWKIEIYARSGKYQDDYNILGVSKKASSGYDRGIDISKPPAMEGLHCSFDRGLARDVRKAGKDSYTWNLNISSSAPVTLRWKLCNLPEEYGVWLIDGDKAINMKEHSTFNIAHSTLKIKVMKPGTERIIDILQIADIIAYPNPARSEITFQVKALTKNAALSVTIYNIVGQIVRKQELTHSPKSKYSWAEYIPSQDLYIYESLYNCKNNAGQTLSKGLYFFKITATEDGESTSKIGRMVIKR